MLCREGAVHHGLFGGPSPSEGKSRAEVGIVNRKVARRARAECAPGARRANIPPWGTLSLQDFYLVVMGAQWVPQMQSLRGWFFFLQFKKFKPSNNCLHAQSSLMLRGLMGMFGAATHTCPTPISGVISTDVCGVGGPLGFRAWAVSHSAGQCHHSAQCMCCKVKVSYSIF